MIHLNSRFSFIIIFKGFGIFYAIFTGAFDLKLGLTKVVFFFLITDQGSWKACYLSWVEFLFNFRPQWENSSGSLLFLLPKNLFWHCKISKSSPPCNFFFDILSINDLLSPRQKNWINKNVHKFFNSYKYFHTILVYDKAKQQQWMKHLCTQLMFLNVMLIT